MSKCIGHGKSYSLGKNRSGEHVCDDIFKTIEWKDEPMEFILSLYAATCCSPSDIVSFQVLETHFGIDQNIFLCKKMWRRVLDIKLKKNALQKKILHSTKTPGPVQKTLFFSPEPTLPFETPPAHNILRHFETDNDLYTTPMHSHHALMNGGRSRCGSSPENLQNNTYEPQKTLKRRHSSPSTFREIERLEEENV